MSCGMHAHHISASQVVVEERTRSGCRDTQTEQAEPRILPRRSANRSITMWIYYSLLCTVMCIKGSSKERGCETLVRRDLPQANKLLIELGHGMATFKPRLLTI